MIDQSAYLRIREGGFFYLIAAGPEAAIEHRSRGQFEAAEAEAAPLAAWHVSETERVPVYRLGLMMESRVGQWEYAVLFSDGARRIGIAAAHVQVIPEAETPGIQPFNPAGARSPGGLLICGVCPDTRPEYLVLDADRLRASLGRVAAAAA